jgi:ABC-type sugar transport system substrate-binding protein
VTPAPSELAPRPTHPWIQPDDPVGQALLELLDAQGVDRTHLAGLDPAAVAAAIRRAREERRAAPPAAVVERDQEIDLLERRIAKLTQLLGMTEDELRRVAAQKGVEFGLPSVYRTVQGLAGDDSQRGMKSEMMRTIFEANLRLLKESKRPGPPPQESTT